MSGGVDSSVAAALLKKGGFDVVGVFMKFWSDKSALRNLTDKKDFNRCCSVEAENLARLVAKKIGIPFYVVNVEKEFKKKVVDYFLKEYKKGNTPNPCVVCNKEIKFGFLIKKALSLGADYVATGHYARITLDNSRSATNFSPVERFPTCPAGQVDPNLRKVHCLALYMGRDEEKDQSYFLWQLNQKQLSRVLFPVGEYTKPEVRELAKKFNLPTAEAPESQEVCFVPASPAGRQNATNEFLKKYLKIKPGLIIEKSGKVVGKHNGLWFYTIGQRKGIEVQQGPWFVVGKNLQKNQLIVSKDQKDLLKKELIAKNVSWISGKEPKLPIKVEVKIRYKSDFYKALIRSNKGGGVRVIFEKPQRAITPGQSVVFYLPRRSSEAKAGKGKELLGGGVINTIM